MTDLEFVGVRDITVNDVLESRRSPIPCGLLRCCMVSDGGGAVVIASAAAATAARARVDYRHYRRGDQVPGKRWRHYGQRRRPGRPYCLWWGWCSPAEIDVLMAYDSFSITVMCLIEDLEAVKKARGQFVERWPSRL